MIVTPFPSVLNDHDVIGQHRALLHTLSFVKATKRDASAR